MITKKKSSLLRTRIRKNMNSDNSNKSSSPNSQTLNSASNYNYNNNTSYNSNKYSIVSINSNFSTRKHRKKYKTFLTKVHTLRRMKRVLPIGEDRIAKYIDDNRIDLIRTKIIKGSILDKYFFNHNKENCICENIYKLFSKEDIKKCKCSSMKTYNTQKKSILYIKSLKCSNVQSILKVLPLDTYYMKMRMETKNYMFIELDNFTIQTVINNYVNKVLPSNSINIMNSGVCNRKEHTYKNRTISTTIPPPNKKIKKDKHYFEEGQINGDINSDINGDIHGYNLISEAELGSGSQFLLKLLSGYFDKEFEITNEDKRYMLVVNFLLQSTLIIGHLQSSSLELFHGNYKPDNVFIKKCKINETHHYNFNILGKKIQVKNMGFVVLIANFNKSSITIKSEINNLSNNKYRFIPTLSFNPILGNYVNDLIQNYGDIDPDIYEGDIKINKVFISKLMPIDKDPTIHILRSAGIKLYRDFDLYTFIVKLLDNIIVREYILKKKLDTTILSFMSTKFKNYIFNRLPKTNSLNETSYIIVDILDKINEPLPRIFNNDYYTILKNLNYKLFKQ